MSGSRFVKLAPFETALLAQWPEEHWGRYRMILAVSGGADSVALLCAFARIARLTHFISGEASVENFRVVHVNHGLRGEESEGDARFVRELANRFSIPFREERMDSGELVAETEKMGSLEGGARNLRYRLLLKNAQETGARFILTAHHAGDQIETILHRLFRGSGIDGLTGMSRFRPLNEAVVLARPLLSFTRREILDYLAGLGETYRTDSSNASPDFLRNRIRNELIPLLNDLFPHRYDQAVLRLADHCRELQGIVDHALDESIQGGKSWNCASWETERIPLDVFREMPEILVREFFRRLWKTHSWPQRGMTAERWSELARMAIEGNPPRREFFGNIVAKIVGKMIMIGPCERP